MSAITFAEEKGPWIIDVDANVTLTQNAYSESWIGSEKGAISWASKLHFIAERQLTGWFNNRNTLKLEFGQTKTQNDDGSWGEMIKATDLIDFEALGRFKSFGKSFNPFIAFRLISQFFDERDSLFSHYVNPMDLFESFGVSRKLVANDITTWDARFGGAVHQAIDRFYFDVGKETRETRTVNDAGLEFVTELKTSMRDGLIDYNSLLTIYEALISSESEEDDESSSGTPDWRYPDVNWENNLSINITKYVMVNLKLQLLYDREKHYNARIKEVLAIGLTYKFNNRPKTTK